MSETTGEDDSRTDAEEPLPDAGPQRALAKVREFPTRPGVYLFKDDVGRVIYIGKA